jgi:putative FmdB family regulatory protein
VPLSFAAVPVYDYRCERCTTQFEVRQSFSDDTLTVCPPIGGPASCVSPGEGPVKKVFSGVAIAFKGDGFYKNDHGSIAKGRRKEKEASSTSSNGSSSASKDSKDSSSSSDSASTPDSSRSKADAGASSSSSTS